jgi:hypothetical protein
MLYSLFSAGFTFFVLHLRCAVSLHSELLYLDGNEFAGPIPEGLDSNTGLQELRLGRNELTGALPVDLFNLDKLEELLVQDNNLNGTVSNTIGDNLNFQVLLLNDNQFTGVLPPRIWTLQNLGKWHASCWSTCRNIYI